MISPAQDRIAAQSGDPYAYFDVVYKTFQEALDCCEPVYQYYRIGGELVEMIYAGDALLSCIAPAFAHLRTERATSPALTICLWDSASTGFPLPSKPWSDQYHHTGPLGVIQGFNNDRIQIVEQRKRYHGVEALHLFDQQRSLAIFWTPSIEFLPYWAQSYPLSVILHCWAREQPLQLLHAAAVGKADGGVLLVGRSGSGKSTTALTCLRSDLFYAGDDTVLAQIHPEPYVYSLYNSTKVVPDNLHRLPHLSSAVTDEEQLKRAKALMYIKDHFPAKLIAGFPIRAILVLNITNQTDTCLESCSPMKTLTELAPTTIFQMRSDHETTLHKLTDLAQRAPNYTLHLGTDLEQIARTILDLLGKEAVL